jgi:hypothetical protein
MCWRNQRVCKHERPRAVRPVRFVPLRANGKSGRAAAQNRPTQRAGEHIVFLLVARDDSNPPPSTSLLHELVEGGLLSLSVEMSPKGCVCTLGCRSPECGACPPRRRSWTPEGSSTAAPAASRCCHSPLSRKKRSPTPLCSRVSCKSANQISLFDVK